MIVLDRIAPLNARGIDDVQDETRPLHMAQEVMSEPHAIRRTLDEPRNVSHDEALLIVRLHDAEHGRECRKVVVGDLRARRRTGRDETGFPDARIADKPHVREQLQLEDEFAALPRLAELRERRRAVRGICEFRIPASAAPAADNDRLRIDLGEIGEHLARRLIRHDRAGRDVHIERRGVPAVLVLVLAVLAVLRREFPMKAEREERIQITVGAKDNISAAPAVTTRRAALGHEFLMAERGLSMSAVPRLYRDMHAVYKLHTSPYRKEPAPLGTGIRIFSAN